MTGEHEHNKDGDDDGTSGTTLPFDGDHNDHEEDE